MYPHPVTTASVPTGTGLHSNVMGCTLALKVKAGLT